MPEHAMEETAAAVKRPMRSPEPAPHARVPAPGAGWDAAGAHAPGAPSAVLAIQRTAGNQAVMRMLDAKRPGHPLAGPATAVQRSSENALDDDEDVQRAAIAVQEPSDEAIRSAAVEGVRTPSTTLPHLDRIQASFGRHSIAHVQAHVGPEAARASRAMNALAYASGNHVVFGATPDLRTAAHEAAHIVQQQGGVQLSGGIGRAGDPYERHADAVADAVVAARSAEGLLQQIDSRRSPPDRGARLLQPTTDEQPVKEALAVASRSTAIQRRIRLDGKDLNGPKAASTLVFTYGLPRTRQLLEQCTYFAEDENVTYTGYDSLIKALKGANVPLEKLKDQVEKVNNFRQSFGKADNYANAYIFIGPPYEIEHLTPPRASGIGANNEYGNLKTGKAKDDAELGVSKNDSEVLVLTDIDKYLFKDNFEKLKEKPDVYIRIYSNSGPCNGCKNRIDLFKNKFKMKAGYGYEERGAVTKIQSKDAKKNQDPEEHKGSKAFIASKNMKDSTHILDEKKNRKSANDKEQPGNPKPEGMLTIDVHYWIKGLEKIRGNNVKTAYGWENDIITKYDWNRGAYFHSVISDTTAHKSYGMEEQGLQGKQQKGSSFRSQQEEQQPQEGRLQYDSKRESVKMVSYPNRVYSVTNVKDDGNCCKRPEHRQGEEEPSLRSVVEANYGKVMAVSGEGNLCYIQAIMTGLAEREVIGRGEIGQWVETLSDHLKFVKLRYDDEMIDAAGLPAAEVREAISQLLHVEVGIRIVQRNTSTRALMALDVNAGALMLTLLYTGNHFDYVHTGGAQQPPRT